MYRFNDKEELLDFIRNEVLTTQEAIEYLEVTPQAFSSLVKRKKVIPIKEKLYLKSDLEVRKKEAEQLKKKYRPYD